MKPLIFFFIFIILVSGSYAYDCGRFSGVDYNDCLLLNNVSEDLIADIIYKNNSFPNHEFIADYNNQIVVFGPPNDVSAYSQGIIKNAWISILTITPSIIYNNTLFIPESIVARTEYNYTIVLPSDYHSNKKINGETCKIEYSKDDEQSSIQWIINNNTVGTSKIIQLIGGNFTELSVRANIQAVLQSDDYLWRRYCCAWSDGQCIGYCFECEYHDTDYDLNNLTIEDNILLTHYVNSEVPSFTIIDQYSNTSKGILENNSSSSITLSFDDAYFEHQKYYYTANFTKKPYYFLELNAYDIESIKSRNIIRDNNTIYTPISNNCTLEYSDFFNNDVTDCQINLTNTTPESIIVHESNANLRFLFKIVVFIFVIYLIYLGIRKYWGKIIIPIIILLAFIPTVRAEDCGLTNLATCIPQKIYDFILNWLNAPLAPLLNIVKNLLQSAPSINLFQGIWAIIIYCLSLFYGILFVYCGFQFLTSGHDVIRREMAKEWLKNTVIMIVLIQASYYLYGLIVDIGSIMTTGVLSMVDEHFFMITADNLINFGLELLLIGLYVIVLLFTMIFLTMRYLIVAFGVLFAPIGIFCYYIPPLRSYGKLILNILGMFIFITFLDAIIILACSMLIDIEVFQNIKIIVMITCFIIINILSMILTKHIIHKTSIDNTTGKLIQAGKYIAMMA